MLHISNEIYVNNLVVSKKMITFARHLKGKEVKK